MSERQIRTSTADTLSLATMTKEKDAVDLDSILAELGQFGRYQIKNYCFILIPIMFSAVYNGQYIFAAAAMNYRYVLYEFIFGRQ